MSKQGVLTPVAAGLDHRGPIGSLMMTLICTRPGLRDQPNPVAEPVHASPRRISLPLGRPGRLGRHDDSDVRVSLEEVGAGVRGRKHAVVLGLDRQEGPAQLPAVES